MVEVLFIALILVVAPLVGRSHLQIDIVLLAEFFWKELFGRDVVHGQFHLTALEAGVYTLSTKVADWLKLLCHDLSLSWQTVAASPYDNPISGGNQREFSRTDVSEVVAVPDGFPCYTTTSDRR